tara:strand:+ start:147 stop:335 length:189 start_codon:yes stop_codon:yes gene_type:complete
MMSKGGRFLHPFLIENVSLKCLENCEQLAGLDRKQVRKLIDEFSSGQMKEDVVELVSEYPPL